MIYYTIPPSSRLSAFVRLFWVLEGKASPAEPYIHRSMADGCCEMIFHYRGVFRELLNNGETTSSIMAGINGPSSQMSRFVISEDFSIFGAYLYPFAVPALFGLPVPFITNQQPDLLSLLGQPGKDLEEKMMIAADNSARVQILSEFIEGCLYKRQIVSSPIFQAVSHIIQLKGVVSIDALSSQYFLSMRQFERKFKEYAGFSPKLYSRIIRFQAAMSQYSAKSKSLTEISYECGYYDQSHFIHDFKEFSGYHPRVYFSGRAEGTSWRDA